LIRSELGVGGLLGVDLRQFQFGRQAVLGGLADSLVGLDLVFLLLDAGEFGLQLLGGDLALDFGAGLDVVREALLRFQQRLGGGRQRGVDLICPLGRVVARAAARATLRLIDQRMRRRDGLGALCCAALSL
jgi:hypothetical protein